MTFKLLFSLSCAALLLGACSHKKDEGLIAVSTNFHSTFEKLETAFEAQSEFNVTQVNGATGQLYTQIVNGAPFQAFLSADQWRPQELREQGLAGEGYVYAKGVLVLWSKSDDVSNGFLFDILSDTDFKPVAIANPALAPYGAAAQETFVSLNINMRNRLVIGENVGQAFAMAQSGNARAGFVAQSDALRFEDGYFVTIDSAHYGPIRQEAVLLKNGQNNAAAQAFLEFLQSPDARSIILSDGYQIETVLPQ